jgi:hypothetical protein
VRPQDFVDEIFIGGSNKARVLHAVTEDYLRRERYPSALTLVRPDQYVAWRGETWTDGALACAAGWCLNHDVAPLATASR